MGIHEKRHYTNDGHVDKIAFQCEMYEDSCRKGVIVVLENGEDGVYAYLFGRFKKKNGNVENYHYDMSGDGTISFRWLSAGEYFTGSWTSGDGAYQAAGLRIHGVSPINTASTLAFPNVTLADITNCHFVSGYRYGKWAQTPVANSIADYVAVWPEIGEPQKIAVQFTTPPGTAKTSIIALTNGDGGVYAEQVLGISDGSDQRFAFDESGNIVVAGGGVSQGADTYSIQDLYALPPCVKGTPTKIWSDVTLADIERGKFTARFSGRSGQSAGTIFIPDSAIGCNKKLRYDNNSNLTNLVVEFQTQSGNSVRCVIVSFTDDGSDVYATGLGARYANGTVGNYEFHKEDGTFKGSYIDFANTHTGNYYGVCDLRVKMPTQWTLDQDMTWSELSDGKTLACDEVVRIKVTAPDAVLTIDENVNVEWIEFVDGSGAKLSVSSGKTLTIENISGIGDILNNGIFVKTGDDVATVPFNNASTGVTIVSNGTLKAASVIGTGSDHTVRVKSGATFDLNCVWATAVAVVLEEGANFANSGNSDAVWGTALNIRSLTLEGNATVTAARTFGLRVPSHGSNTLDLGTYTLAVNASSGKSFFVDKTTINGTGKILLASGTLFSFSNSHGDTYTLEVGERGTLAGGAGGITCGNFVNHGSIDSRDNKIIVKRTLTPGKALIYLELIDGATIKASATQAQVVSTTFTAIGSYTIEASAITKEQLKEAAAERIPVLTVPTAQKGGTWTVANPPVDGCCAKWIDNEDGTSTLYICRSSGTMIIVR